MNSETCGTKRSGFPSGPKPSVRPGVFFKSHGGRAGGCSSRIGHLGLTESDGQLQVLLLLLSQPLQPLAFRPFTLSFGPLQLLSLVPKLPAKEGDKNDASAQKDS